MVRARASSAVRSANAAQVVYCSKPARSKNMKMFENET